MPFPPRSRVRVSHQTITTEAALARFCQRLAAAQAIAFDTEFVSEHTYRPQLCLVQVACDGELAVIDPLAVGDLTPFWKTIADFEREIVVHAGREEMIFCLAATGRQPSRLFDVQIAAGLAGLEYPAGYGTLVSKLLGQVPRKAETRTDWRHRPLAERQIAYALEDVRHLAALRDALVARLEPRGRRRWLETEMTAWQESIALSLGDERWRRVAGSSGLPARGLAIIRELWRWRDAEARRRDSPSRRILRDDLIVELARHRTGDPKHIAAIRGFERGDLKRAIPDIARHIQEALSLPEAECPRPGRRESNSHLAMLGQFLSTALSCICREQDVATSLVGTTEDVRDLIAWHLAGADPERAPALAQGWRADVVGQTLEDVLAGRVSIRIRDPDSDQPLAFERAEGSIGQEA
jgi:ribonuclease D